jgi:hypothetical protein
METKERGGAVFILEVAGKMKSISIRVNIEPEADRKKIVQAAEMLPAATPRFIEASWSANENDLDIRLTAYNSDIDHFLHDVSLNYKIAPNKDESSQFANGSLQPAWLKDLDPQTAFFFVVSTTHGHAFANFDLSRAGTLLTPILSALQKARFGWLQVGWYERNLTAYFNDLSQRMASRYYYIDSPVTKVRKVKDEKGRTKHESYTANHPDKHKEFHTHYKRLSEHLSTKAAAKHVVTIIRGVTQPFVDLSGTKSINDVAMPFSVLTSEGSVGEHLTTYYYRDPRILLDLCGRRVIEPAEPMKAYVSSYLSKWRARENLPFLILSPSELSLFVHLPEATKLWGLRTTRVSDLPQTSLPQREGIVIAR